MRKNTVLIIVAVGLSPLFSGCKKSESAVVARVGRFKMTSEQLSKELAGSPPVYLNYLSTIEGKKQFLDILLKEKILLNAARRSGVLRRPEVQNNLKAYLDKAKQQEEEFRKGLLLKEYLNELQTGKLKVEENEIRSHYESNKSEFQNPIKVSASHILSTTAEDAEKALKRVKSGEDFAKVAKEVSKDPTAFRGGLIGEVVRGDLADIPEFESELFNLKTGGISGVVKTKIGYHIIKKDGETRFPALAYDQAAPQIRRLLEKKKFDAWIEEERKRQKVWIDEKVLAAVPLPAASQAAPQENAVR